MARSAKPRTPRGASGARARDAIALGPQPRRTRRRNVAAAAVVVALAASASGIIVRNAEVRTVEHQVAGPEKRIERGTIHHSTVPAEGYALAATWPTRALPGWRTQGPVMLPGAVVTATTEGARTTVAARAVPSGRVLWSYSRELPLCGVERASNEVVTVWQDSRGCGDVVALGASTGQYYATREAIADDEVVTVSSSDRVGTLSPRRVELWRRDLARTVEVGTVFAPVEHGNQTHQDCRATSALTTASLLAIAQDCPEAELDRAGKPKKLVRLMATTPAASQKPEDYHEFTVPHDAELVAVSEERAAIIVPGEGAGGAAGEAADGAEPRLQVLHKDGSFAEFPLPGAQRPAVQVQVSGMDEAPGAGELRQPIVAPLSPATTWFDGRTLWILDGETLEPQWSIPGAWGTGARMGTRLLVPVAEGIAVWDEQSRSLERIIPVERPGQDGGGSAAEAASGSASAPESASTRQITLRTVATPDGGAIVEQEGSTLRVYMPTAQR